jgi:hypothetical protein
VPWKILRRLAMSSRDECIRLAILRAINDHGEAAWSDIMVEVDEALVREEGEAVPNGGWMEVRNILQGLINEGLVKRTESVYVETYTR